MPQKSTDGVNMMNKCWWCVEEFKDHDRIISLGSKLYHDYCLEEMDDNEHLKPYEKKYPYLSAGHVERLFNEGLHCFNVIDDYPWIVILEMGSTSEIDISGFKTKEDVEKFIASHHKEDGGGWDIDAIYNCGQRYFYQTEIKITLTPSKL
jgi:hypothetical protein